MDGLLTAVKTVSRNDQSSLVDTGDSHRPDFEAHTPKPQARPDTDPTSADYILEELKSKPDSDHLFQVLATLDPSSKEAATRQFDIRLPSPATAQILQVLVSTTIPDHWDSLKVKPKDAKSRNAKVRAALLRCLCSVAGVSSLVAQLRTLITAARSSAQHAEGSSHHLQARDILAVLSALLKPKDFLLRLYAGISSAYDNGTKVQVAWKEFISLIASSKVLSIAAEALTIDKESSDSPSVSWVGEGHSYATWLGQNICYMVSKTDPSNQERWKAIASLTSRALSLGYTGNPDWTLIAFSANFQPEQLVREIYSGLLVDQSLPSQFALLLDGLRQTEQIAVLEVSFRDIQRKHFSDEVPGFAGGYQIPNETVRGVATLLSMLIGERSQLEGQIADWLSAGQGGSIHTIGLRRAILANFASRKGNPSIRPTSDLPNISMQMP
jgi:telomere length regulation protein